MSETGNESLRVQAEVTPDAASCATSPNAADAASRIEAGGTSRVVGGPPSEGVEGAGGTSQARIDANRANAQHSTGPRTPEGKARVARNAIRHGLLSRQTVLPTDDPAEFEEFHAALWLDLKAIGAREEMLAERIVAQYWRLRRAMRVEACLFDRDSGRSLALERTMHLEDVRPDGEPVHPAALGEAIHQTMGAKHNPYEALRRYERTIQRDLDGCAKQLEEWQRSRRDREGLAGPGRMPHFRESPTFPEMPPFPETPAFRDGLRSAAASPAYSDCPAAWAARSDCPASPAGSGDSTDPVGSARGEAEAPLGFESLGSEPVGFVSQSAGAVACRVEVHPVGAATTEARGSASPVVAWQGDANHGTEPVGFVSQPAAAERDITGRRRSSPRSTPPRPSGRPTAQG